MTYKFDHHRIESALQKAKDTRHVLIGSNLLGDVDDFFVRCFGEQKAVIIADENTFAAAGKRVFDALSAHQRIDVEPFIFPSEPILYADYQNVLKLESFLKLQDAVPIAVGSGTINDLTKLASYRCHRPYLIVATAASMDGYTAYGAAITKDSFKQTIPCSAPYAVLVDLDVVSQAPHRLTASGYGDVLGKITAGADWIIADTLGIDPIIPHAWLLVQDTLRETIGRPGLLKTGDTQAIGRLIEGLILCGLSMQAIQASRPASGSEHQFSHLWEMHETEHGVVSHGFKVGVGSIASAALYEQVLKQDLENLDVSRICAAWPPKSQVEMNVRQSFSNPKIIEEAVNHSLAKYIDPMQLALRLEKIKESWPTLKERLKSQLLSASEIYDLLKEAGCPAHPTEIGHSLPDLKASYALARKIRSRYTIFDFAAETGCFDDCVDQLFAPGGFWERAPHK
ncbi:MAG: sn-glycerol-1-phosphate dehydrogenase [Deltaproteobacteria bacterium]|nr:sn-glycerol-1-phosphate dehydrogenase [Deltaproteobacteria bacterium]